MWMALVVAVVLVGLTVAAVFGRIDGSLVEPTSSLSYVPLPEEPLTGADIRSLRLDTGLRGYRMEQVDEVIDRLSAEITQLNDLLIQARGHADVAPDPQPQPPTDHPFGMPSTSPCARPGAGLDADPSADAAPDPALTSGDGED